MGGRGGGRPGCRRAGRGGPAARRRTPVRGARLSPATDLDDLAREALLVLSSDWAFMVSRDSAAGYARERHDGHRRAVPRAGRRRRGTGAHPGPSVDGALASHLDARSLVAVQGRA